MNKQFVITARIVYINKISDTFSYVTLENALIVDKSSLEERRLPGNISLSLNNYSNLDETYCFGDIIAFTSNLTPTTFFDEKTNDIESFYVKSNIRYLTDYIDISKISIIGSQLNIAEKLKEYNRNLLVNSMGEIEGNLAFSLLYGDKSTSDKETLNTFKYSGVIHMFSVSGLHVSIIVAVLFFILKKLKANDKLSFIISFFALIIFCYLCSFTASVVRASIMCLVYLFSRVVNRKNDILNSISMSGIILLPFNPMTLFDGGFQLSFMAVFGIILFSNIFSKLKFKNKVSKYIVGLITVSISTQLAIFPILAKFYGYFATWSIVGNLISLPIFSVFYPILFAMNIIVLIMPFLSFIYVVPLLLFKLLILINSFISSLPFATFKVKPWGLLATFIYYASLFCISKYLVISSISKVAIFCALICVSNIFIFYNNIPFYNKEDSVVIYSNSINNCVMLTTDDNKYYILNPKLTSSDLYALEEDLKLKNIDKIEAVFLCFYQSYYAKTVFNFLLEFNSKFYTIPNLKVTEELIKLGANVEEVNETIKITDDIIYKPILYGKTYYGSEILFKNKSIMILNSKNMTSEKFRKFIYETFDIVFFCVKLYNAIDRETIESIIQADNYFYITNKNHQMIIK